MSDEITRAKRYQEIQRDKKLKRKRKDKVKYSSKKVSNYTRKEYKSMQEKIQEALDHL